MSAKRYGGLQYWLDRKFEQLAAWSVEHTGWVIGIFVALAAAGLYLASTVTQDNSLDAYFDPTDPAFMHYKAFQKEFNSDEVIYLVYEAEEGKDVFDLELMRKIESLTRAIETEVPFVRKANSLANIETIEAEGDDIVIRKLTDLPEYGPEELQRLREFTLVRPLYVGTLVSKDAKYGAIFVEMTRNSTDPIEKLRLDPNGGDGLDNLYPQAADNKLAEILARPEYQGLRTMRTGDVPWNTTYNYMIDRDLGVITLATLGLSAILCMLLFRTRLLGLLAPISVVILGIIMSLAVMGAMKYQVNLMFLALPTLICAIGIAQAVHMLMKWQNEYAECGSAKEAARRAMSKLGTPALLCALTTAAGILGMSTSHLKVMREYSIYASLGILLTFVVALLLMTSFAARSKGNKGGGRPKLAHPKWLERLVFGALDLVVRNPRRAILCWVVATVLAVVAATQMKVDFNFMEEFNPKVKWRQDTAAIEKIMGGVLSVAYVFDTGRPDGIQDPELIRGIESLQNFAEQQDVVADTTSIVDYLKELNQAFHGGDPAYRVIPQERDALAQLMLVYELSGGKEMNDIRNIDRSKTVLELRVKVIGAAGVRDLVRKLDAHLAANPIPGANVELSGIGLLWIKIVDYIASSQIKGVVGSFFFILAVIVVSFGSLRIGLWAMVPNVLPFVFLFGFMGLIGWHLDYFKMMLASVIIGLAIDDTIYFLARMRVVFAEVGDYRRALQKTMHEVGIPIAATTFALMAAFASYLLSDLDILKQFGILLSGAVFVAWIIELLFTPAMLMLVKPFGPEFDPQTKAAELKPVAQPA
jgi:predicted RND superfamily exporter protein